MYDGLIGFGSSSRPGSSSRARSHAAESSPPSRASAGVRLAACHHSCVAEQDSGAQTALWRANASLQRTATGRCHNLSEARDPRMRLQDSEHAAWQTDRQPSNSLLSAGRCSRRSSQFTSAWAVNGTVSRHHSFCRRLHIGWLLCSRTSEGCCPQTSTPARRAVVRHAPMPATIRLHDLINAVSPR